ncbi:hypothetical protein FF1_000638 [Malus domestica]
MKNPHLITFSKTNSQKSPSLNPFFFPENPSESKSKSITINSKTERLVRRTTMVATVPVPYFLLTADYRSVPNALDPVSSFFFPQFHLQKSKL